MASITLFVDFYGKSNEEEICILYRQHDGEAHGRELKEFLHDMEMTTGVQLGRKTANGMPCLAAQVITHFKDSPGEFYVHSPKARLVEYYLYILFELNGKVGIKVVDINTPLIYEGLISEWDIVEEELK